MSTKKRKRAGRPPHAEAASARPAAPVPAGDGVAYLRNLGNSVVRLHQRHDLILTGGLAALAMVRARWDGMVYPAINTYFFWGIALLMCYWAARLLFGGANLRHGTPIALFAGFLAVALLTGGASVQWDATYRHWLTWCGHFFLFVLMAAGLRSRAAVSTVLGAYVVALVFVALFGILHLWYIMPQVRLDVKNNPMLLVKYFGFSELTPELKHRIEVNRAFGNTLFPNALAALLIVGIPYTAAQLWAAVKAWPGVAAAWREGTFASHSPRDLYTWFGVGVAVWFAVYVAVGLFVNAVLFRLGFFTQAWSYGLAVYGVPTAAAAAMAFLTHRAGGRAAFTAFASLGLPIALLLQGLCLYYTWSRGGILALTVACAVAAVLVWRGGVGRMAPAHAAAAAAIAVVSVAAWPVLAQVPGTPGEAAVPLAGETPEVDPEEVAEIDIGGRNLGLSEFTDPATARLRLNYWKVGLAMAKSHLWTGVGLGNFGTLYPKYQDPGATDVKTAHNDFLQMLVETGVFGFAIYLAFWGYFVIWGARRIWGEPERLARMVLGGIYAGALALMLHSIVDFPFVNPSLAFYGFLFTGAFYAYAAPAAAAPGRKTLHQFVALPLLVGVALTGGASLRLHQADAIVGDQADTNVRMVAAQALFGEQPYAQFEHVAALAGPGGATLDDLLAFAEVRVPDMIRRGEWNTVGPGSEVELGFLQSYGMVVVEDAAKARAFARAAIERRIAELERADRIYPHNPQTANLLYMWTTFLFDRVQDVNQKKALAMATYNWAKAGAERSPEEAVYRNYLGHALWRRAQMENVSRFLEDGLDAYRMATALQPLEPQWREDYGRALREYGAWLQEKAVDPERGRRLVDEGQRLLAAVEAERAGS